MDEPIPSAGPTCSKLPPVCQLGLHSGWEGARSVGPRPACLRRADFREHGTGGRAEVCALESQGFTLVTMQSYHRRGRGVVSWRATSLLPGRTWGHRSPDFQLMCSLLLCFLSCKKRSSQL